MKNKKTYLAAALIILIVLVIIMILVYIKGHNSNNMGSYQNYNMLVQVSYDEEDVNLNIDVAKDIVKVESSNVLYTGYIEDYVLSYVEGYTIYDYTVTDSYDMIYDILTSSSWDKVSDYTYTTALDKEVVNSILACLYIKDIATNSYLGTIRLVDNKITEFEMTVDNLNVSILFQDLGESYEIDTSELEDKIYSGLSASSGAVGSMSRTLTHEEADTNIFEIGESYE